MSQILATRRNFLAGLGAAAVLPAAAARAQSSADASVTALWQQLELTDSQDNSFSIASLRKPLTLVKLWANWCPVCINEIEKLDSLVSAMGPQNMEVVLVSHPDWWNRDREVAQERQFKFRVATPDWTNGRSRIQAALTDGRGMYAVPRTLVFGKAGEELVLAHQGALNLSNGSVVEQLRDAIA